MSEPCRGLIDRPILIVSSPRSGSTLLFETMERAPGLFSTGNESHQLIESVPGLSPAERGWSSNRLTAEDCTDETAEALSAAFYAAVRDRDGNPPSGPVRILEKTPKNSLRIPFFDAMWPDSRFIYLYRDWRQTMYSMMEAWSSGHFRTYPQLPGWGTPPWSLLLVPGWEKLNGMKPREVIANQWAITTQTVLDDLEAIGPERVTVVDYSDFLADPQTTAKRLARANGLNWDLELGTELPMSKTTVSRPQYDKWRRLEKVIESVEPITGPAAERASAFLAKCSA